VDGIENNFNKHVSYEMIAGRSVVIHHEVEGCGIGRLKDPAFPGVEFPLNNRNDMASYLQEVYDRAPSEEEIEDAIRESHAFDFMK
jgi:hypothetical protein